MAQESTMRKGIIESNRKNETIKEGIKKMDSK